jgi:hypothetical protein
VSYAQFDAETQRRAMWAGVAGAILGALVSVVGIRIVWNQNARNLQFDRLAGSSIVQQQRRLVQAPAEAIPDPYAQQKRSNELPAQPGTESDPQSTPSNEVVLGFSTYNPPPTEVNAGGIKVIHWTRGYGVESLETEDGKTIYPTPEPSYWAYFLIAMCPVVGYFIPWAAVQVFSKEATLFSHHHAQGQAPTVRRVRR